jgi:hypothetical protein
VATLLIAYRVAGDDRRKNAIVNEAEEIMRFAIGDGPDEDMLSVAERREVAAATFLRCSRILRMG